MNERRRKAASSKITHVLFRKDSGWTPAKAKSWLKSRGVRKSKYETSHSQGGEKLKSGTYYVFRIAPVKGYSSFGYSAESKSWPGVWFKFGGHRGKSRKAKESECGCIREGIEYGNY